MDEKRYSLRYRSSRMEVWRWYWRAWLARYGWWHLLIAAAVTWLTLANSGARFGPAEYSLRFVWIAPLVIALMAAWPQLAFKSQEPVLEVGPEGWSSRIAGKVGSRAWKMVASIQSNHEIIALVSDSGNALLIPRRAFQSESSREAFLSDIRRWHAAKVS
ncbi:hypothetical protein EKH80_09360 [Dyella choica]|uniref:YcxB family protein n=1 Tax=Dyella choica TaxID=1927959 RepID=A0A432M776_9GAMM|nr:hypothetical protein EKH80_09360 [Dyella choica]